MSRISSCCPNCTFCINVPIVLEGEFTNEYDKGNTVRIGPLYQAFVPDGVEDCSYTNREYNRKDTLITHEEIEKGLVKSTYGSSMRKVVQCTTPGCNLPDQHCGNHSNEAVGGRQRYKDVVPQAPKKMKPNGIAKTSLPGSKQTQGYSQNVGYVPREPVCIREQPEPWSSNTPFTETLVGEGVWILWKEEGPVGTYFFGRVTHYNKDTGFHYVEYEDGDKGYEDMNHPSARWLSVGPC